LPADAAEKQRFYVQQVVRKPQRVTIRQYMSRMGVLNDYIAHLPSIYYSPKDFPMARDRLQQPQP
jgi:hypothetical protein